jgi:hypothetical protein
MSDAARSPATDYSDVDALVDVLVDAHRELERTRRRVDEVGEDALQDLRDRYEELTALFDRYEERVTGDGDFQTFIEFQGKVAEFTEELPEEARHRDVFEDVDDLLQQRRLTESDWERVRERLAPVWRDVERLTDREEARDAYRDARYAVAESGTRRADRRPRTPAATRRRRPRRADRPPARAYRAVQRARGDGFRHPPPGGGRPRRAGPARKN